MNEGSGQPSTSSGQPSTSSGQPSTSSGQPSTSSGQRRSLRDQSRSPRGQSSTSRGQSSTSREEPSTSREEPSTSREEPGASIKVKYEPLGDIVRTVHFDHYLKELRGRKMRGEIYTPFNGRSKGWYGLLYRVKNESATSDMYGNYTYTINFNTLANTFIGDDKYKVYCKDPVGNVSASTNRLLIANPLDTDIIAGYYPYNQAIEGGPWYQAGGTNYWLNTRINEGPENKCLEFLIKFSADDAEELRLVSTPGKCNHSTANTQACFKYPADSQWCPSPWNLGTAITIKEKLESVSKQNLHNAAVFTLLGAMPQILKTVRARCNRFQPNKLQRDLLNELQKVRNKSSRLKAAARRRDNIMEIMIQYINGGMEQIRRDLGIGEEETRTLTPNEIEQVKHIVERWMQEMLTRM